MEFRSRKKDIKTVEEIIKIISLNFKDKVKYSIDKTNQPHEAHYLKLDITKATKQLNWKPKWNIKTALNKICEWMKAYQQKEDIKKVCIKQIQDFCKIKI